MPMRKNHSYTKLRANASLASVAEAALESARHAYRAWSGYRIENKPIKTYSAEWAKESDLFHHWTEAEALAKHLCRLAGVEFKIS